MEAYWGLPSANIFAFARTSTGEIVAGTNDDGRIFSVVGRGYWKLLQQSPKGGEISVLMPDPTNADDLLVITSNPGGIYRLQGQPASEGKFTSPTVDAGQIAQWGNLHPLGKGGGVAAKSRPGSWAADSRAAAKLK